jgi:hypothetical protein
MKIMVQNVVFNGVVVVDCVVTWCSDRVFSRDEKYATKFNFIFLPSLASSSAVRSALWIS